MFKIKTLAGAAALALLPLLASAQTDPKAALRASVGNAIETMLGSGAAGLVDRITQIKFDGAISRNFDAARATTALFGRSAVNAAADCRTTTTAAKEPDTGLCVIDSGLRDSETGAYTALAFSKNLGLGEISFVRRAAFNPKSETLPASVKLSDAQAYDQALKFMDLMGVPRSEIPVAPAGVKNPLPVRSLVAGVVDPKGGTQTVTLSKTVQIPRAFVVPGGLLKDAKTGIVLNHVIAPGAATLTVTDAGVQFARISGWNDAQWDPKLNPRLAKSTSALVSEITDDLWGEGVRSAATLSVLVSLRRAYPNPDDPNPPLCPVCGVFRPGLQVIVSQVGLNAVEPGVVAPAGVVREYDLVGQTEAEKPAR
jgi:hypothetical protein